MRHVDPFGDPTAVPAEHAQEVADELRRVVEGSPLNAQPLEWARRFLLGQRR